VLRVRSKNKLIQTASKAGVELTSSFSDNYMEWYDPRRNMTRLRMLKPGIHPWEQPASVEDAVDMIELLLERYQMTFNISEFHPWQIQFPYLFIIPKEGDLIHNRTKDEVYTVEHVSEDPYYGTWDHWVRLSGSTKPDVDDILEFVQKDERYVRFTLGYPRREAKEIQATGGELGNKEAKAWAPTVTVRITRREPASIGKEPFDRSKELKPRLWETFRDPQDRKRYSIEIWYQRFDNLVQFDCWDKDPADAIRLVNWFEEFMRIFTGTLKYNGVQEIWYWDRRDHEASERWREDITAQTVRYVMRTEYIRAVRKRNLTWMRFEMQLVKDPVALTGGAATGEYYRWFGRTHNDSGEYLYGTFVTADLANTGEEPTSRSLFAGAGNQFNDSLRI
jgi:hypothetical protein